MPRAHRAQLAGIVLIALVSGLALPVVALAADQATLSGTVTRDGTPVGGVEVAVTVDGSDLVLSVTSAADGTFELVVDAVIGSEVAFHATGPTASTGPDQDGCVHSETPTGSATLTLETLAPEPISLVLDQVISSTVCRATARPDPTPKAVRTSRTARPDRTLPPTDTTSTRPRTPGDGGGLAVLAALATLAGVSLVAGCRHARPGTRA